MHETKLAHSYTTFAEHILFHA